MNQTKSDYKQLTVDFYDNNAQKYAEYVDGFYSTEQVTAFIGMLPSDAKVLDVGSGSGRDVFVMSTAGIDATGLDLSEGMIKFAQEKYPELKFVHGDMLQIPFPEDSFDGIWAHGSLFHLETNEEIAQAFSEFRRVLKPNGMLHILVKLQKDQDKIKVFSDEQYPGTRLYRFFTQEELKQWLESNGFEIQILDTYDENERNPRGRHDVTWLHSLSKKIN